MLKNHIRIIRRLSVRNPFSTFLTISCLSIGIATSLLILLYLDFELQYDHFHQKADRIYRVETTAIQTKEKNIDLNWNSTPGNLGPYMQQEYPEVQHFVRFYQFFTNERLQFRIGNKKVEEQEVYATDPQVFEVFTYELVAGDKQRALEGPNKMVISESLAKRLMGIEDPIGKIIEVPLLHRITQLEQTYPLEITGVFKDLPRNTHLFTEALISSDTDPELAKLPKQYFSRFDFRTYALLNPEVDPLAFAPKLTQIYENHLDTALDPVLRSATHTFIPIKRIHLTESGGWTYIYIFGGIGILVIVISMISFVNLITAQSSKRALEIGIRKVIGSNKKQLIRQFLSESTFFTLLSVLISVGLIYLMVGQLNEIFGLYIQTTQLWQGHIIASIILLIFIVGIMGGSYPAFFLSSLQVVSVLKGQLARSVPIRKYLLTFQFAIVIFVLASTGMIYQQLHYIQTKDLGFKREGIVQATLPEIESRTIIQTLKDQLTASPFISSVATCNFIPGLGGMARGPVSVEDSEPTFIRRARIDHDYFKTMEIPIVQGRDFSYEFPADSAKSAIVNQSLVAQFNLGDRALGANIKFGDKGNPNFYQVVGIVNDYHQSSLHDPIEPQMYVLRNPSNQLYIQIDTDFPAALEHIRDSWTQLFPSHELSYSFLDQLISQRYEADLLRAKLFTIFTLLTIFVAFIGLYGLAAFLTHQRTKEIGIRKVFGAPVPTIIFLILNDFLWFVGLAAIPGIILAIFTIRSWLENFAYQTELNYGLFGLVIITIFLLTIFTVGFHALKVAKLNPRDTLAHE